MQKNDFYWKIIGNKVILKVLLCIFYIYTIKMHSEALAEEAGHNQPLVEVASTGKIHHNLKETHKEQLNMDQRYAELYLRNQELQKENEYLKKIFITFSKQGEDRENLAEKIAFLEKEQKKILADQEKKEKIFIFREKLILLISNLKIDSQQKEKFLFEIDQLMQEISHETLQEEKKTKVTQGEIKVLEINKELSVAIVNCGALQGLKPGMFLTSTEHSDEKVITQVIEVRQCISAIVVVSGRIKDLYPDMKLKLRE